MRRCRWVGLLVLIAGMTRALAPAQTVARSHTQRAKILSDFIENVSLTDSFESIGGASIEDAANMLRENVAFPVALEIVEFERPKDFLTIDEALAKLHEMQSAGSLGSRDKDRLGYCTATAKVLHPPPKPVFPPRNSPRSPASLALSASTCASELNARDWA